MSSVLWAVGTQVGVEGGDTRLVQPGGIQGTLVIVGGGSVPDDVPKLLKSAVSEGRIVIIGDASEEPDKACASANEWLATHGLTPLSVAASDNDRITQLVAAIDAAHGVWICGGQQSRLAGFDATHAIEAALQRLLERDGIVGGTSAGAAIMSKVMIASGREEPEISTGWDLLPGAIVDQHFTQRNRLARSQKAVQLHPECFGLGIDESTAVVVRGRRMQVIGDASATVLLANCDFRSAEVTTLKSGEQADLTQLRRAAKQRSTGVDPGIPVFGKIEVAKGSLVIVGGGSMPVEIVDRFVELAGGENANIVVLPTASPREQPPELDPPAFLVRSGAMKVTVLPQRGVAEVETDEFRSALQAATGIWFGGGRQWNFVDAYENTEAVQLFRDVLERGGVIGGSSAGATIQGEFLVRGHPLGNSVMMAEGYERGFAFLPGTAIDQHFSQRDRQPDMIPVIRRHPKLLGIGIDEGTAVVVTGTHVDVIGQHAAHFLASAKLTELADDAALPATVEESAKFYTTVQTGNRIDLAAFHE